MITCDQCRDEMAEFALGQLAPAARAAIDAHLVDCVVCRRELAEIQNAWAALPLALEPAAPRDRVLAKVLGRMDAAEGHRPPAAPVRVQRAAPTLSPRQRAMSWVVAASVAGALVGGSLYWSKPAGTTGDATVDAALHDLAVKLGKVQELEQMLSAPGVKLTSLHPPANVAETRAYILRDNAAGEWHFYATGLSRPAQGRAYQLWAVVEGKPPLAGPTFTVDARGLGSVVARFPSLDPQKRVTAFITQESAGGAAEPSEPPLLEASL